MSFDGLGLWFEFGIHVGMNKILMKNWHLKKEISLDLYKN